MQPLRRHAALRFQRLTLRPERTRRGRLGLLAKAPAIKLRLTPDRGMTMLKPLCVTLAVLLAAACTPSGGGGGNVPTNAGGPGTTPGPVQTPFPNTIPAGGLIGADLTAARQSSDFFNFFHLAPTGPEGASG